MANKSTVITGLLMLLAGLQFKAQAQTSITFIEPVEYNLRMHDVVNFMITHTGPAKVHNISMECKERSSGEMVFSAGIEGIELSQVPTHINTTHYGYKLRWSNPKFLNNNLLRFGKFNFCVTVTEVNSTIENTTECMSFSSLPVNPPVLISPENNAIVDQLNPMLIWMPPTPGSSSDLVYDLKLVRMMSNQHPVEALQTNIPIYSASKIRGLSIQYPFTATPLKYRESYAWQVSAFEGSTLIGSTEIWKFTPTYDSLEALKKRFSMLSFTRLKSSTGNEVYTTAEDFCIELDHFDADSARLEVMDASVAGKRVCEIDTKDLLFIGDNKYVLNLRNYRTVKAKTTYVLKYRVSSQVSNPAYLVAFSLTPQK